MKSWLEKNDIEMYSTHNEEKSVIVERLIRTLRNRICKCMTSISKKVYIDKLDDIVNKYNNTYHSTIETKPADVKSNTYFDSSKEINGKNSKVKIGDIVRISKYKNILVKGCTPNCSADILMIKKLKNTVPWTYLKSNLNGDEIVATFYLNELQKVDEIEKVIKRKGDKLYAKWKGCDS